MGLPIVLSSSLLVECVSVEALTFDSCHHLSFHLSSPVPPNSVRELRTQRVNWTKGCYLQHRAFPLQGDPAQILSYPLSQREHLLAALQKRSLWTRWISWAKHRPAGMGQEGSGIPGLSSSPLLMPNFHFVFQQGYSDFSAVQTCGASRHVYAADLETHREGFAGLHVEGQCPHLPPPLNVHSVLPCHSQDSSPRPGAYARSQDARLAAENLS